jgi:hypothetical protein
VTIKGKFVHITPKWYIMVLAIKNYCTLVFRCNGYIKKKKMLYMSTDQRKKDRENSSFALKYLRIHWIKCWVQ